MSENLVASFQADVMHEIRSHRAQVQTPGVVDSFCDKIESHLRRYRAKGLDPAAEQQISAIADAEITRARENGRVEFAAA